MSLSRLRKQATTCGQHVNAHAAPMLLLALAPGSIVLGQIVRCHWTKPKLGYPTTAQLNQ